MTSSVWKHEHQPNLRIAIECQVLLGNYSEADTFYDRAIQLAPDVQNTYSAKALCALLAGDPARAHATLATTPGTAGPELASQRRSIEFHSRRYDKALEAVAQMPDLRESQFSLLSRALFEAIVYAAMEQPARARTAFETARQLIEAHAKLGPEDANVQSALALANAGLGRKEEAVRLGLRALEVFPANRDVWIRQYRLFDLVHVYIWVGGEEAAIDRLEEAAAGSREQVSGPLLRSSPVSTQSATTRASNAF